MDDPNSYNSWTVADWMHWHDNTAQAVGNTQANQMFLAAWNETENYDVIEARSFDPTFRAWAKANGLLPDLYSRGLSLLSIPLGVLNDILTSTGTVSSALPAAASNVSAHIPSVAENAGGAVDEATRALNNAAGFTKVLLPLALVVLFVVLLKDPEKGTRAGRNVAGGVRELLPF